MSAKFQMRGRLGWFSLVSVSIVVAMLHRSAHAQGANALNALRVERGPGAEECPDAASLGERIVSIRGRTDTPNNSSYELSFTHTADTFSATIRSGPNGESQRVLEGHGPTCAAVAQAAAVTLALLFDSDADSAPAAKPEPPPPPPQITAPPPKPTIAEAPRSRARIANTLSLGAAGVAFVLRPLAPALSAEIGLRVQRLRVGLGVLWIPTQSLALDPGHVSESLISGAARTCVAIAQTPSLEFGVCSGLFVGAVNAQAEGFTNNEHRRRSWLAVPLELTLADLSGSVGWEASATALGSLVHQDFEVDGLGVAYRAPRVGAMLTLRAVGLLTW